MIATVLLIGIFSFAAVVVGAIISDSYRVESDPLVDFSDFAAESTGSTTTITFTHVGGESLDPKSINVVISGINNLDRTSSTTLQFEPDTEITFGETLQLTTAPGDPYYPAGNQLRISIIYKPSGNEIAGETVTVT